MHVGIDQAGQDVQTGGIDCLLTFWQSVVCADCDDLAVIDGDAALERRLRGYDRPVLHDQICFHHILPYLGLAWRGSIERADLVGVEHPLDVVGIGSLGQRQREQDARLPRWQIVAGHEPFAFQPRASNHAA